MLNDIKDSIKAKLYDFAYTPFMSSMLISWVVINHKYLLVFFADYDLEKKLALLKEWDFALHTPWVTLPCAMNVFEPILFGLFYVFVYPKISKEFYGYTLERTKELKKIKQDIEDETPITQEQARELRREHYKLADERDQALEKLKESQKEHAETLTNALKPLQDEIQAHMAADNVSDELIKKLEAQNESLKKSLDTLPAITAERDELKERFGNIKYVDLKTRTVSNVFQKTDISKEEAFVAEDDRTKILRFFYESNYKTKTQDSVLDQIVDATKMARPKATVILNGLVKEGILRADQYNNISITDSGNQTLLNLFDKSSHPEELN